MGIRVVAPGECHVPISSPAYKALPRGRSVNGFYQHKKVVGHDNWVRLDRDDHSSSVTNAIVVDLA